MGNTSASDFEKSTTKYVKYVTFDMSSNTAFNYPGSRDVTLCGSRPFVINLNSESYNFNLKILPRSNNTSADYVAALKMEPIFAINNESKDWSVKFSILDVINQKINEKTAYFAVDAWICPNLIEVCDLHRQRDELMNAGNLVIVVEIDFEAGKKKAKSLVPSNLPKCRALDDFGRLFDEQILTDVTLNICGKEVKAHKAILSVRSTVFSAMFEHEMIEKKRNKVDVADMDFEVFTEMLRFIYTGESPNIATKTDQLLAAADMYDLKRLKIMCEVELRRNIRVENAADILTIAELHGAEQLKIQAIDFFTAHATDIMDTEGYKTMKKSYPHLIDEILRASMSNSNKQLQSKTAQRALLSEL